MLSFIAVRRKSAIDNPDARVLLHSARAKTRFQEDTRYLLLNAPAGFGRYNKRIDLDRHGFPVDRGTRPGELDFPRIAARISSFAFPPSAGRRCRPA